MSQPNRPTPIEAQIEWHIPDTLPTQYVTNILIQHTGPEFILSFFEIRPPIVLTGSEAELESARYLHANCLARLVISADRMPEILNVLNSTAERVGVIKEDSDNQAAEAAPSDQT